ncbi:MAG: class I tRNA ligase family protein, partial [Theionarchaea archaeon]|nr:class I tRNA ligase family protein [Theionarchaea archaeon]
MDWDDTRLLEHLGDMLDGPNERITIEVADGPVRGTPEQLIGILGTPTIGGSYFTMSDENNYSIWRFLKTCHQRGWIYKGADVVPWCPRCSTALSEHELDTEGYREMSHLSPFVRFPLRGRTGEYLLVWTTTPWTLSSNVAIAVNPDLDYVKAEFEGEIYHLAKDLLLSVLGPDVHILENLKGSELEGMEYEGPYDHLDSVAASGAPAKHAAVSWDLVSSEEGTG